MSWQNASVCIESCSTYHGRAAESASRVKTFIESPRKYFRENILGLSRKVTDSMQVGTAIHEEVLLDAWLHSYVEIPEEVLSKSGSKAGTAWKEFQAANAGRVLLKSAEIDSMLTVMASIGNHSLASSLLEVQDGDFSEITFTADAEVLMTTEAGLEATVLPVRSRLDFVSPSRDRIVDLKTTGDLSERAMRYKGIDSGWDIQAQFYRKMCKAFFGRWFDVDFVVAETKEPYRVEVWSPSVESLKLADERINEVLQDISSRRREWDVTADENIWQKTNYAERNFF